MNRCKVLCVVLVLMIGPLGPLAVLAQSQADQTPAQKSVVGTDTLLAGFVTVLGFGGHVSLCGFDMVLSALVIGISMGTRYADAAQIIEGGCGGPWVITPEMLGEKRPTKGKDDSWVDAGTSKP